jgi:hypothetical protein
MDFTLRDTLAVIKEVDERMAWLYKVSLNGVFLEFHGH